MNTPAYASEHIEASEPSPGVLLLEFNRGPVNAFHDLSVFERRESPC
jgi:hypothetical protein